MANARKDSHGYALRTGECQRSDGRYSYSYTMSCKINLPIKTNAVKCKKKERRTSYE